MKKLYCFFTEDDFIVSDNYLVKYPSANESLSEFLDQIQKDFFKEMKIVQLNFESGNSLLFSRQHPLYDSATATVFILNSYEILPKKNVIDGLAAEPNARPLFQTLETKSAFIEKVNIIKREISAGRVYQVNLTAPLKAFYSGDDENLFKNYFYELNGSYQALLPLSPDLSVISFSPELFLQKKGNRLVTRPIKGSLKSDLNFEKDLITNVKEEAELSMIVDLLRNDLNRVDASAHAIVTQHRARMQLGYIQHSYSEIEIQTAKNLPEVVDCTFPGGSISGCPKVESLKLISELEQYQRQIYTGSIGWWKESNFTLNLAIRSFVKNHENLFYHAGCGIVFDSNAEHEWEEFILKTGKLNAQF